MLLNRLGVYYYGNLLILQSEKNSFRNLKLILMISFLEVHSTFKCIYCICSGQSCTLRVIHSIGFGLWYTPLLCWGRTKLSSAFRSLCPANRWENIVFEKCSCPFLKYATGNKQQVEKKEHSISSKVTLYTKWYFYNTLSDTLFYNAMCHFLEHTHTYLVVIIGEQSSEAAILLQQFVFRLNCCVEGGSSKNYKVSWTEV